MPNSQPYGTAEEVKTRTNYNRADKDALFAALILGASRAVDRVCNRDDGFLTSTASARRFVGSGSAIQRIDECTRVTAVAVKDSLTDSTYTAWAATDYYLFAGDPRFPNFDNPPFDHLMVAVTGNQSVFTSGQIGGRSYQDQFFASTRAVSTRLNYNPRAARGEPTVQVTAFWGYADTVPPNVREATLMVATRFFKRYESSMADVLADGELGTLLYRQAMDPDVKMLLISGRFVRPAAGRK